MTHAQARSSVLLASSPSALVIVVIAPLLWAVKDSRGYDWLFWPFLAVIPFSMLAGVFGLILSLEQSLTRRLRSLLFALNGASLGFGWYLIITLWRGLTASSGLHQF